MKSFVRFSIKQTVLLNVVFVILVVAGAFSIFTTPLENMPVVDMGNVFIHTVYYGASADDVEQLVTAEIENALDGLEDVEYIKSDSYQMKSPSPMLCCFCNFATGPVARNEMTSGGACTGPCGSRLHSSPKGGRDFVTRPSRKGGTHALTSVNSRRETQTQDVGARK